MIIQPKCLKKLPTVSEIEWNWRLLTEEWRIDISHSALNMTTEKHQTTWWLNTAQVWPQFSDLNFCHHDIKCGCCLAMISTSSKHFGLQVSVWCTMHFVSLCIFPESTVVESCVCQGYACYDQFSWCPGCCGCISLIRDVFFRAPWSGTFIQ